MRAHGYRLLLAVLTLAAPAAASAQSIVLDAGTYHVYQNDRVLGTEAFGFERTGDSLFVHSEIEQTIPTPNGDVELSKVARLLLKEFDFGLVLYESVQQLDGQKLVRAIVPDDTTLMVYREGAERGEGIGVVRPPGKLFILDPQVFSLFDLICRDLHGKKFTTRPLQMFVLAASDTALEASATDLGTETIRWGAKPVQARKLRIGDDQSEFFAWVAPHGVMLRLTQPASGLRVERNAPPVKPASQRGN